MTESTSYLAKVGSRLDITGLLLLAAGAALTFGSAKVAERLFPNKTNLAGTVMKFVGLALAVVGALILLDFI